uniref:Uncharacterized protein n=1 Tax=Ditylenchus dipsaci TaxID=166011 RepID=A0A915DJM2_9BILA
MVFQAIGVYEQIMRAMASEMFLVSKMSEKQFTDIYKKDMTKEEYLDQLIQKFEKIVDYRMDSEMYAFDRDVYKKAEIYWIDQRHERKIMSPEDNKWWEKETG